MAHVAELSAPVREDEEAELLSAIDEGVRQLDARQGIPIEEAEQRLEKWLSR